jgi:3-oxoacyl-ACP reductase-like protein
MEKKYLFMPRAIKWTLDRDFHPRKPSSPSTPASVVSEPGPPPSPTSAPAAAAPAMTRESLETLLANRTLFAAKSQQAHEEISNLLMAFE